MPEAELDRFMAAMRRLESGSFQGNYRALGRPTGKVLDDGRQDQAQGAYQIMRSNWAEWAREAGVPGADWRDPKAQDRVARYKFMQYYRRFGSWDLVAVAWFAGPGRAQAALQRGISAVGNIADVTGTSVSKYVGLIRQYMGNPEARAASPSLPPAEPPEAYAPSWVAGMAQTPDREADAERQELESNLTDMLETISSAIAGGDRRLPALHKPPVVGVIEPPGQEDDGNRQ